MRRHGLLTAATTALAAAGVTVTVSDNISAEPHDKET
jgi:hypothetical protein